VLVACTGAGLLVSSPVVMAIGSVVAIALLLLHGRGARATPPDTAAKAEPADPIESTINPTADPASPMYRPQPNKMVAKYQHGDAAPGRRQ